MLILNSLHYKEFLDISHIFHRARRSNLSFLQFQQACSPNNPNFSANDAILLGEFHSKLNKLLSSFLASAPVQSINYLDTHCKNTWSEFLSYWFTESLRHGFTSSPSIKRRSIMNTWELLFIFQKFLTITGKIFQNSFLMIGCLLLFLMIHHHPRVS